jgi:hypothetical protein
MKCAREYNDAGRISEKSMVKSVERMPHPRDIVRFSVDSFRPVSGLAKMPLHLPAWHGHAVVFRSRLYRAE